MSEKLSEAEIVDRFKSWFEREFPESVAISQFKMAGGRVDVAAFNWPEESEFEIHAWGIECKKDVSSRSIYSNLDQLSSYGKYFPFVYLLVGRVREENNDHLSKVANDRRFGIFCLESPNTVRTVHEARPGLFGMNEYREIRAKGVALLTFVDLFGKRHST